MGFHQSFIGINYADVAHHINEERDDKSFMEVERVSWG
jgi:hypothetical protein